ncbi:MAG: hypothetical protein HY366_03335, partial [Candidatus Aenigmarchaeota archaeon]|nr:hypothetical protein [Candidatus Aenigmarchaeota archaeon]
MLSRAAFVVCLVVVLLSTPVIAQSVVSHPAADVSAGNFSGDFRFTNGFLYIGDALGGVSANAQRTYLAAPDGSVKLSAYNDRLEIGTGGLKFADGSTMASAATNLWQQSGTNAYYSGGNVGIGTTSPSFPIHVSSTASKTAVIQRSSDDSTAPILTLRKSRGTEASPSNVQDGDFLLNIEANSYSGQYFTNSLILAKVDGTVTNLQRPPVRLEFYTNQGGGSPGERMRISKEGNVGIGTTNPVTKLDIRGGGELLSLRAGNGGAQTSYIKFYPVAADPADVWGAIGFDVSGDDELHIRNEQSTGDIHIEAGRDIRFRNDYDATTPKDTMILLENGNVGIGKTNPAQKLHIGAGGKLALQTPNDATYGTIEMDNAQNFLFKLDGGLYKPLIASAFGSPSAGAAVGMTFPDSQSVRLGVNGNAITIVTGNNVGIGTATPAGKLDVAGSLCISGVCKTSWPSGPTWRLIGTTTVSGTGYTAVS